ncbi:MAG TPA: hypothetical protein VMZ06_17400 [Candidatus Bathyarchaeia archaeon]|nr:hypothetical protein [Candidatus Bathyarchaeia archaeon]
MRQETDFTAFVKALVQESSKSISNKNVWYALRGALDPELLITNLAETLRVTQDETLTLLQQHGFGDLATRFQLKLKARATCDAANQSPLFMSDHNVNSPISDLFNISFVPSLTEPVGFTEALTSSFDDLVNQVTATIHSDPFAKLFRHDVLGYHDYFISGPAVAIDEYVAKSFPNCQFRYIITSGIGANEQYNHYISHINNLSPNKRCVWLVMNSPRELRNCPADATIENTLFMEFSRSGKTEETLKIHEYTPREAKRIVFANSGPLREIGERDGNLILELPDEVSGRFGRNKTPILLAPMHVCHMNTRSFWSTIEKIIAAFDLSDRYSLPAVMAQYIFFYQLRNSINHIYIGCNNDHLMRLVDEFTQFWNEGVNKGGNDIMASRYVGLPRDSHMTIEGILGNHKTKMAMFVFANDVPPDRLNSMISHYIDPIDPSHEGLEFGDEEEMLAEANFQRFSECMPCIKINVNGLPSLDHAAVISQLWADVTFFYSRLKGIDPGSNPEVKFVRDRSTKLLAEFALKRRSGQK